MYYPEERDAHPNGIAVRAMVVGPRDSKSEKTDWVSENTDFDKIMFSGADHFASNDLPAEIMNGYRNSHWTPERLEEWARTGEYPYRSTIVWPVRGQIDPSGPNQQWSAVGFLCVDSPDPDVFDLKLDVVAGELIAEALYGVWPRTQRDQSQENDAEVFEAIPQRQALEGPPN